MRCEERHGGPGPIIWFRSLPPALMLCRICRREHQARARGHGAVRRTPRNEAESSISAHGQTSVETGIRRAGQLLKIERHGHMTAEHEGTWAARWLVAVFPSATERAGGNNRTSRPVRPADRSTRRQLRAAGTVATTTAAGAGPLQLQQLDSLCHRHQPGRAGRRWIDTL